MDARGLGDPFDGLSEAFLAARAARAARDTVADDCAESFLTDLDEALWLHSEVEQAAEATFPHAARKADHLEDLRRLLYRLHLVLITWEEAC